MATSSTPPVGFGFESPQTFADSSGDFFTVLSNLGQPNRTWSGLENVALERLPANALGAGTAGGTDGAVAPNEQPVDTAVADDLAGSDTTGDLTGTGAEGTPNTFTGDDAAASANAILAQQGEPPLTPAELATFGSSGTDQSALPAAAAAAGDSSAGHVEAMNQVLASLGLDPLTAAELGVLNFDGSGASVGDVGPAPAVAPAVPGDVTSSSPAAGASTGPTVGGAPTTGPTNPAAGFTPGQITDAPTIGLGMPTPESAEIAFSNPTMATPIAAVPTGVPGTFTSTPVGVQTTLGLSLQDIEDAQAAQAAAIGQAEQTTGQQTSPQSPTNADIAAQAAALSDAVNAATMGAFGDLSALSSANVAISSTDQAAADADAEDAAAAAAAVGDAGDDPAD